MIMKINVYIISIFFGMFVTGVLPLSADEFFIDYLEGNLEIKEGSKWIELNEDDSIDISAVLRLEKESMAELSGGNINITLIKPGTYVLEQIVKETQKAASYGIDDILSLKLAAIADDSSDDSGSASMGVRAANMDEELDFIGDEIIQNIFKVAKKRIEEGKFKDAISLLDEAYELGDLTIESILLYYIGYCYSNLGSEVQAISYLQDVDADSDVPFYSDYVILYGSLLMKSFAYSDALALFSDYIKNMEQSDSQEMQQVYYLASLCYIYTDDVDRAAVYLSKAEKINPESATGKKAQVLLVDLK